MPRAIWKGAITFGLVNVPVELRPAEDRREFKFSMLDKRDFAPVGFSYFLISCNCVVRASGYDGDAGRRREQDRQFHWRGDLDR